MTVLDWAAVIGGALVGLAAWVRSGAAAPRRSGRGGGIVWDPSPRDLRRVAPPGRAVVYVIRAGASDRVKVGTTTSLARRVREIANGAVGERAVVEAVCPGGPDVEAAVHRALAGYAVRPEGGGRRDPRGTEWFVLPAAEREVWRARIVAALPS